MDEVVELMFGMMGTEGKTCGRPGGACVGTLIGMLFVFVFGKVFGKLLFRFEFPCVCMLFGPNLLC